MAERQHGPVIDMSGDQEIEDLRAQVMSSFEEVCGNQNANMREIEARVRELFRRAHKHKKRPNEPVNL